jgi:glycosyltransferase involved in cell wall biosynthesis
MTLQKLDDPTSSFLTGDDAPERSTAEPPGDRSQPLRIGIVAPPWFTIPPAGYGGIERVVAMLADGLAGRGHRVTLFSPAGSTSDAMVVPTVPVPMHEYIGSVAVETQNVLRAYSCWREFDVIHDHTVAGLAVTPFLQRPLVHTVHGAVLPDIQGLYAALPPNVHLVAISENQRATLPPNSAATVIRNATNIDGVEWSRAAGDHLLFVGRASVEKGPLDAIRIAEGAGMPLRMLLKVNEKAEHEYFEFLRPHLRKNRVQVELQVTEGEKQRAYAGAFATLFPIAWEEPFGLVMIESMAAGTPVIAFARGAAPEVIADGVTGFLCSTVDEAISAVQNVPSLDRRDCRTHVEEHFSPAAAVDAHETLYRSLVAAGCR